ncbi:hypothetical protein ORI89_04465 [Sphingobacterium sp. UT-1RO-CII-1]|uniref:hypothetical protein n=1 Tax=Sphingobacterium sp. UT-1RO-CII-1 TaxID=2995225 RepID=UPI00227C253F|nr:hypothetical protein [Sphingobacterium sp. UT-1RO-CII-1]MCY4778891.1 hypothetical protein [Sphingobacterium sp. UT-1RO-CII-1]
MEKTKHYYLTPLMAGWIEDLVNNKELLNRALKQYESPINIHCINNFQSNVHSYSHVLSSYGLRHKIYYARKANKCLVFPLTSWQINQGIDTASYREVKQCLDAGIPADSIVCTAAVKNRKLLEMLVQNQVEIVLDNEDEMKLLQEVCENLAIEANVILRLSGFVKQNKLLKSRFGFRLDDAYSIITERIGKGKEFSYFRYYGLHFHLNGYDAEERAIALYQSGELVERLHQVGIKTKSLDMGGGFLMNYLANEQEWNNFNDALKEAVLGDLNPITYGNDGLGLILNEGKLLGKIDVYPYYNKVNKENLLKTILETRFNDQPLYHFLKNLNLEIRMEPGRSLLDQCGITVAKVAFRKRDTENNLLIGLEMNRTQLRSSSADFLVDPLHLTNSDAPGDGQVEGYLVGAYCLEQEHILKRKILFKSMPQVGDLFVFVNTAGYMMHFYESEAHLFPLAKNLIYDSGTKVIVED